jgi:hypothetical protein
MDTACCVLASFMSATLAAPNLPARFAAAIDLLCRGIAASLPKHWDAAPLALPAWTRLRRLLARFAALVAAVEAGRFRAARRTTTAASRPRPAAPAIRLPGGPGWLLRLAPALETRLGRAQVESLLAAPELGALLAQAPQAGRILRPLCHMLRIEPPPSLRLPRRPGRRPDPSGSTDAGANGGEMSSARAARPSLPAWLAPPASALLPKATPACAPPDPMRTRPPGT